MVRAIFTLRACWLFGWAAAILLDRLRHIQSRRAKEYAEQQRMAVGTNQEVKKATDKIKQEAAEQVLSTLMRFRILGIHVQAV